MAHNKYHWKRFWVPREGRRTLSPAGWLEDPEAPYGNLLNPDARTLESLTDIRCLALLGEPGIGKSEEVRQDSDRTGDASHFELRDFQTDIKLCQDIFDNAVFQAWLQGNKRLDLYLDSLDEGLLTVKTLATLLTRELKKYPRDRLHVRIACRTAEWPDVLETGLKELWGENEFKAYELLPLREKDIAAAAQSENIDPQAFIEEVLRQGVGPLASKPVTLKFLLNVYRKHAQLPQTRSELYLEGCRHLCEEANKSRLASNRRGKLNTAQKLTVAERIAATSIFANRAAIWTGLKSDDVPESDLTIDELTSGMEGLDDETFHVGEDEIRETLNTGLFSSRGPNRIGWSHLTYAEFLAARYLIDNRMAFDQKMALITHPVDPRGKLIPQLHETSAWLAGMEPDIFRQILKADPVVLLRSDVASAQSQDRASLVEHLLQSAENEEWVDQDWSGHLFYSRLNHPALAEQLRPFITSRRRGTSARRIAADIAEACKLQALQNDLAEVALDPDDDMTLRVNAAYAVVRIGDSETKAKLRPLAFGEAGNDPEDELKGRGLRAVWPHHLSSAELFRLLDYPKRPSLSGSYQSFINRELEQDLEQLDLVVALRWLREKHIPADSSSVFYSLRNAVLQRAWDNIDSPGVADELINFTVSTIRERYGEKDEIVIDDSKRLSVLAAVLRKLSAGEKPLSWLGLLYGSTPLILPTDLSWLIEQIAHEDSLDTQTILADIIWRIFDWRNVEHYGLIVNACSVYPVLADKFAGFLVPVYLGSPQEELQRRVFAEAQELSRGIPKPPPLNPPPSERVERLLTRFESGEIGAWRLLNREMTLRENSTHYGDGYESDLTKLPGWQTAVPEVRERLVESAKRYLLDGDPGTKEWWGKNILHWPAYAGYRALRLLFTKRPEHLLALPQECWEKWSPILLCYSNQNEVTDAEIQAKLVESAYKRAPLEITRLVLLLVDEENGEHGGLFFLSRAKYCWDDDFCRALAAKVKDKKLKPVCMGQILSELLARDVPEAKLYAEGIVRRKAASATGEERSLTAARALVANADDAGWAVIWPRMKRDINFGRKVIGSIAMARLHRKTGVTERLTEDQLRDLFLWLVREYPHSDDPHYEDVYTPGPGDHARRFRDSVLHQLKKRGAVTALGAIVRELPKLTWLKWTLADAQEINRRETWTPLHPSEILKISHNRNARLVQSGEQLLEVLIESLERLQEKLHGETPAAIDLWSDVSRGVYRPKDENRLSDYVKRHFGEDLKARGVVANREVEIRRAEGAFRGQRTDIRIDAVLKDQRGNEYDRISAIVETKGCWNPGLDQAMETQLKGRYLERNQCQFGLYLVGWFNCVQWDRTDTRKKTSSKLTREEAQHRFDRQASSLSDDNAMVKAFVLDAALS